MFPIGDEPKSRVFPLCTYALIAANVAVFVWVSLPLVSQAPALHDPGLREYLRYMLARFPDLSTREILTQTSAYDVFTFKYGFRPAQPEAWSLFASLFLHANFVHLLGNMLFLWVFGGNVEARLGRLGYLLMYLGAGVAATLVFSVFARDSSAPLIGASGAISGVLGAYFLWFPRHRVRLLIFLFFYVDVWRVPARWVLAFYIIVDNLLPFLAGGNGEGVAYGAHLGGFAAGLATALLLGHKPGDAASRAFGATVAAPGVGSGGGATGTTGAGAKAASAAAPGGARRGEAWVLDRSGTPVARVPAVASFVSDVRAGRYLEAGALYAQMSGPERLQQNDDLVLTLAQGLLEASSMAAALAVLQSFIAGRPRSPRLAEAHYQAAVIHLERTGRLLAAREHLHNALELGPSPALESAARRALAAVEESLRQG